MAAASRTTSSSFHNMPHRNGTFIANHGASATSEVTPDLHLKMSKKIAQLTKVIYALNTKNDEHENIVEGLKVSHEEEMQQLIAETKEKISYFKSKMSVVTEHKKSLELLESHLASEKLQRQEALAEFEKFKIENERRDADLRSEYSEKVLSMSKELLASKQLFENRLKEFQAMRKRLEEDRDRAVDELTKQHHEEMDQLMKAHRVRYDELVKENKKLEELNKATVSELQASGDSSEVEKRRIEAEYQENVQKLKALHEKELAALRAVQDNSDDTRIKELEEKEKRVKFEWSRQERVFKDRISELLNQLSDSEQEMSVLKLQVRELESKLGGKDTDISAIAKELDISRQDAARSLSNLREMQNELKISEKKCKDQASEMEVQSTHIGRLEATRLSQESTIRDLKGSIGTLQDRLSTLEGERDGLEKNWRTQTQDSQNQLQSLKKEIENLSKEKADLEAKYFKELERTKGQATDREKTLRHELEEVTSRLKQEHQKEVQGLKQEMQDKLKLQKEELLQISQQERDDLTKVKNKNIEELESVQSNLRSKLSAAEEEVNRLGDLVNESEQGLGSASSYIDSLKESLSTSKEELQRVQEELNIANKKSHTLANEMEALQNLHEKSVKDAESELRTRLKSLTSQLDIKWADRLSEEITKLRSELNERHSKESQASLEELAKIKEQEQAELRKEMQSKIDALKQTVMELRRELETSGENASWTEHQLREEANQKRVELEEEIARLSHDHKLKVKNLKDVQDDEMKKLDSLKEQELKELESKLRCQHQDDLATQLQANKLALEAVKSQLEQKHLTESDELKKRFENDQESLRSELMRKFQEDMQKLNKEFEIQIATIRLQLQRANEIRDQEQASHQNELDEVRQEVEHRNSQIVELDEEIGQAKDNIKKLTTELQAKGQEILGIRREANNKIRKREEELAKAHKREMDAAAAESLQETQTLLAEFNRSKDLLSDKISALQFMLEEAEERFRNRESRQEDLDLLEQLRKALAERELEMKKLVEEKRFFQLELLNRETNFNKMFSTSPQVGIINPLQAKTKVSKTSKATSQQSLLLTNSRLDPIPNMPVHEKRLNNSKPLPPTPPKDRPAHRKATVY